MTSRAFWAVVFFRLSLLGLCIGEVSLGLLGVFVMWDWELGKMISYCISIGFLTTMLSVLIIVPWFDLINPNWKENDYLPISNHNTKINFVPES